MPIVGLFVIPSKGYSQQQGVIELPREASEGLKSLGYFPVEGNEFQSMPSLTKIDEFHYLYELLFLVFRKVRHQKG